VRYKSKSTFDVALKSTFDDVLKSTFDGAFENRIGTSTLQYCIVEAQKSEDSCRIAVYDLSHFSSVANRFSDSASIKLRPVDANKNPKIFTLTMITIDWKMLS